MRPELWGLICGILVAAVSGAGSVLLSQVRLERRRSKRLAEVVKWQCVVLTMLCREVKVVPPDLPEWVMDL